MTNSKLINLSKLKNVMSSTKKRNTLNKSTSQLLQSTSNLKDSIQPVKRKNNLKMAFRKIKQCLLVKKTQTLISIFMVCTILKEVSADARKFAASDITTNIITDPKSVASIDFRYVYFLH